MKLSLGGMLLRVALAGLIAAASLGAADDPFGGGGRATEMTLAEFSRANPTRAQAVSEQPVWVEWVVVEAAALPEKPTEDILKSGRLVRQVTRLNRCAATEQWQVVDRAPDGRALAVSRRVGSGLFTRLLPDGGGRVSVVFFCDWVRPSGWIINEAGEPEVVCERQSFNSSLVVNPGEWVKFGGGSVERVANEVGGKETASRMERGFYLRVLTKPDPSWVMP